MPATGVRIPGHKLVRPPVHIARYSKGYLLIYELPLPGRQITVPGHMLASLPVRTTWELKKVAEPCGRIDHSSVTYPNSDDLEQLKARNVAVPAPSEAAAKKRTE